MRSENARVHAALIAVSLIYGYFYVAVKILLRTIDPAEFILLRFVLTAVLVLLVDRLFVRHPLPPGRDMLRIAGLGVVGVGLVQILVAWGLHYTTAFHSALIMGTIPILTLIFGIISGQEGFNLKKLLGIAIGFLGVCILLFFTKGPGAALPETYLLGDAIVLLNAVAFAWFLLGSRKMLQKYSSFPFTTYCYTISAGLYSLLFFGDHWVQQDKLVGLAFLPKMDVATWLLVLYVVLFASIGSYTLNNYALKRVSPTIVAVYMFLQPIISAITGYYVLHEPFNLQMGAATLLTFIGVLLATSATPDAIITLTEDVPPPEAPPASEEKEPVKLR